MIESINKGICHRRVQTGENPYFVNYTINGVNTYEFFAIPSSMYSRHDKLKRDEKRK